MARQLNISKKARKAIIDISAYIAQNFGDKHAEEFLNGLKSHIDLIVENPQRYPYYRKGSTAVHKSVFNKRSVLLFKFSKTSVTIMVIADARTNWRK
jgi:plasmid stabilization system protein ParE